MVINKNTSKVEKFFIEIFVGTDNICYHVTYSKQDSNGIPTHNHLVYKQVLNHLAKLIKQLSCVMSTYLYGVLDYMLSSRYVCASKGNNIIS